LFCSIGKTEEQAYYQTENYSISLPTEIMEIIISHLDGRTLLKFKTLSKSYYEIVTTSVRLNNIWKNICFKEIPKKYFVDLLNKYVDGLITLDSVTENMYETLYKKWLKWQRTNFNITCIAEYKAMSHEQIGNIISNKFNVLAILGDYSALLSLMEKKDVPNSYIVLKTNKRRFRPLTMVLSPNFRNIFSEEYPKELTYNIYFKHEANVCPIHNALHDVNFFHYGLNGALLDVSMNAPLRP